MCKKNYIIGGVITFILCVIVIPLVLISQSDYDNKYILSNTSSCRQKLAEIIIGGILSIFLIIGLCYCIIRANL
jgi:hypothetical protein